MTSEARHPTPDQFVEPGDVTGDSLRFVSQHMGWKDAHADALRRQLESEQRAVELLRRCHPFSSIALDSNEIAAFLRARDEGLDWPEDSA